MPLRARDFESRASAGSATLADRMPHGRVNAASRRRGRPIIDIRRVDASRDTVAFAAAADRCYTGRAAATGPR
jgi:hypothetical protein